MTSNQNFSAQVLGESEGTTVGLLREGLVLNPWRRRTKRRSGGPPSSPHRARAEDCLAAEEFGAVLERRQEFVMVLPSCQCVFDKEFRK